MNTKKPELSGKNAGWVWRFFTESNRSFPLLGLRFATVRLSKLFPNSRQIARFTFHT
jgi:hypothetical protein